MGEQRRVVLRTLRSLLSMVGSANDAEDRGFHEDADRMRNGSIEAIGTLMVEHHFLRELLPTIQREIDARHILGSGWSELADQVDRHLKALDGEPENDGS